MKTPAGGEASILILYATAGAGHTRAARAITRPDAAKEIVQPMLSSVNP
jgi:hypothetical protein